MGQARRQERRTASRAALLGLASVLVALLVACGSPGGPTPGDAAAPSIAVPVPGQATAEIGFEAPGMDGGVPFVEYRSVRIPSEARAGYDADLRRAGFSVVDTRAGWTTYDRGDVTLWVSVSEAGPPTTIIVRYAKRDARATLRPVTAGGSPAAGATAVPAGSPAPTAIVTAGNPATPEPATRPGGPFATPPGQGNRPSAKPAVRPTPKPAVRPTPKPTKEPKPTPKPTKEPRPTKEPTAPPGNSGGKGNNP